MEKYFVQKGLDIGVINAGMGSFNSLQELQLLLQIVYMNPDLVLTIDEITTLLKYQTKISLSQIIMQIYYEK